MNELWPHNFHLFSYPQFNAHFLKTLDNEVIKHLLHSQTFGMHILFRSFRTNTHTHSHTHMNACTHRMVGILQYEKLLFTHSCNAFMHFCLTYPIDWKCPRTKFFFYYNLHISNVQVRLATALDVMFQEARFNFVQKKKKANND